MSVLDLRIELRNVDMGETEHPRVLFTKTKGLEIEMHK